MEKAPLPPGSSPPAPSQYNGPAMSQVTRQNVFVFDKERKLDGAQGADENPTATPNAQKRNREQNRVTLSALYAFKDLRQIWSSYKPDDLIGNPFSSCLGPGCRITVLDRFR